MKEKKTIWTTITGGLALVALLKLNPSKKSILLFR
jgi:hypothetical protein